MFDEFPVIEGDPSNASFGLEQRMTWLHFWLEKSCYSRCGFFGNCKILAEMRRQNSSMKEVNSRNAIFKGLCTWSN